MTHDLQDRLLDWLSKQEKIAKKGLAYSSPYGSHDRELTDFNQGRYSAIMDVKCFIMTDGKLSEPTTRLNEKT